jgi:hypothetical protein
MDLGKYYWGRRADDGTARVDVCDDRGQMRPLDLQRSLIVANKSPTGFEWGYGGSGPAQLALAILLDALADVEQASRLFQQFKWAKIGGYPKHGFVLTEDEVMAWCAAHLGDGSPDEELPPATWAARGDGIHVPPAVPAGDDDDQDDDQQTPLEVKRP